MDFLEKNLEDILYDAFRCSESVNHLFMCGLECYYPALTLRQVRIGNYGIADLVTISLVERKIRVFELKRDNIGVGALLQASKYKRGINRYLYESGRDNLLCFDIEIILIGKRYENSEWLYLFANGLDGVSLYTYKYGLNGLSFEQHEFEYIRLVDEKFNLQ